MTGRLRLADKAELRGRFGDCEPGAVPPIGGAYGMETILRIEAEQFLREVAGVTDVENRIVVLHSIAGKL